MPGEAEVQYIQHVVIIADTIVEIARNSVPVARFGSRAAGLSARLADQETHLFKNQFASNISNSIQLDFQNDWKYSIRKEYSFKNTGTSN